ncbi:MAG: NAD(P)H-hydrate dehydratase [Desulfobulbaceae bacterium]|nr:NAD(P)H-hydrate dehydratase [Desulfobulbaceae bacterium]
MKLAYAEQMRQLDNEAIKTYGIPETVLMENAGIGTVQAIMESYGALDGRTVLIAAGQGNNGGDGLVIARHILQRGGLPFIFLMGDPTKLKGAAAVNFKITQNLKIPIYTITSDEQLQSLQNFLPECDLIIDAIFGIGLKRAVKDHFAKTIELINQAPLPVISVDIPSGLDSDTGTPKGICIAATLTVTYGLAKPGHFTGLGPEMTGALVVVDISIPPIVIEEADLQVEVLENHSVSCSLPTRPNTSHKGTYGHLLVLAGSRGKTGAALLCARGALRSGAGLVTIATPIDLNHIYETALAEAMTLPLTTSGKGYVADIDYDELSKALETKEALVIGPGLGQEEATGQLVSRLYRKQKLPMVVDADALNLLAGDSGQLTKPPGIRILTPHPGEMARLTGKTTKEIQANRLEIARDFAVEHNIFIVLKGANTIIADPNGRAAINVTGNPALAIGGSGDVLSGFIGSMLAQGQPPWEAATLGVYAHGLAADRLTKGKDIEAGLLASELADELPTVISKLFNNK